MLLSFFECMPIFCSPLASSNSNDILIISPLSSILIDDRIDLKENWEAAGGIFIHHVNTETTIRKLCDLGVITKDQIANGEDDWYWEGSWNMWKNEGDDAETTIHKLCEIGVISEGQTTNGDDDWHHFVW